MTTFRDRYVSYRGDMIENSHLLHIAVTDPSGHLLYHSGDASRITLIRSTAKPVQALAILSTGCFDEFGFNEADLALMCSSHSSEERHVARSRAMLAKLDVKEDMLACGGHPALSPVVQQQWQRQSIIPTGIHNNCSGKHAGMIAGAKSSGASLDGYHRMDHPMQQRVRDQFDEMLPGIEIAWSIDGCNLPAPAMPLKSLAQIYAQFALASDKRDHSPQACVFKAMAAYPELVAGEHRFCTILMQSYGGSVVGKLGADGCYGVAISAAAPRTSLENQGCLGVAVKIEDGNIDVLYSVVVETLQRLGIGSPGIWARLRSFHMPTRYNTAGVEIGRYEFDFELSGQDPV